MSLKFESFPSAGGAGTDTLDDVTGRGSSTTNSITVGGLTIGTEYSLPTTDGASNTYLRSDGAGNLSFAALDITGGLEYKGEYTGQSLVTAEKGDFYIVSGSQTLAGVSLSSGDHIVFNTNATDPVLSTQFDVIDNTETTPTLDAVTTQGASTTNDVTVGGLTVQGDISADSNLTRSIGDETNRFISYFGDVNGAIRFKAKNDSGAQLTKGQVVTITGVSGTVPTVDLADSNDSAKMPAFGLVYANANDQAEVQIVSFGNLENVNTGSFSAGDTLYVSTTAGALTATKPTGESSLLQNIGRVVRSNASAGVIIVGGAGRTAATPNLDQDKVFLGNASNQATPTALSSIALSSFNDDLSYLVPTNNLSDLDNAVTARTNLGLGTSATLDHGTGANEIVKLDGSAKLPAVDGSLLQNLPSASAASETVAGIIEIATNLEAQGASATDKALVPSNLSSIALSSLNDDLSYLVPTNNLSDLDNAVTARTNLGLGTSATLDHGTGANEIVKLDGSARLPQVDGSQLTNLPTGGGYPVQTATSSVTADLNSAVYLTAASATACTVTLPATSGASDGDAVIIVRRSPGSLTIQQNGADSGTLVTYLDAGNASSHTITNNQQQIHVRYDNSGTRWYIYDKAQGTAATLDVGTTANKIVQLDASAKLPAVDGSNLTNVGKFIDYQLAAFNETMIKNNGYRLTANNLTLTLPARSTLSDGDYFAITAGVSYSVTVALDSADSGTNNIFYNVGSNSHSTTSHTLSIYKQEIFIRFNGTSFFITSETKLSELSGDSTPQLGGDLDTNTNEIVTASNRNLILRPNGTGAIQLGGNTNPAELRLYCESNDAHYVALKSPTHTELSGGSVTWRLPTSDASTSGDALVSDGSGNLSFTTISGGSAPSVTTDSTGTNTTISTSSGIEEVHLIDNTTNNVTITIPAASSVGAGYKYNIKRLGSGTVSITPSSGTIDTASSFSLASQYDSVTLVSDNSNYHII